MIHFPYHAGDLRSQLHLYRSVDLPETQCLNGPLLGFRSFDRTSSLSYLNFCHVSYPLNTLDNATPLFFAMLYASRIVVSALKVAFTTLCGLDEPLDFANTL